jgi:site-specific recombinase XerD
MSKIYMAQQAQAAFAANVKLAGIDYKAEREAFIENAGRTRSRNTARAYRNALNALDAFCTARNISALELTPKEADDFIYAKAAATKPATARLAAAAASSFFAFLERRHSGIINNPFRGTKARPAKQRTRPDVPTAADVDSIIKELPPKWAAAVSIMAFRGLRVGALAGLSIKGSRFTACSKGHDISGDLPPKVIQAVNKAKLELRQPFQSMTAAELQHKLTYELDKLHKAGKIRARFSPHKFRHFFAVTEYSRDYDLRRVRDLLFHSSIAVTETYLRSLDQI